MRAGPLPTAARAWIWGGPTRVTPAAGPSPRCRAPGGNTAVAFPAARPSTITGGGYCRNCSISSRSRFPAASARSFAAVAPHRSPAPGRRSRLAVPPGEPAQRAVDEHGPRLAGAGRTAELLARCGAEQGTAALAAARHHGLGLSGPHRGALGRAEPADSASREQEAAGGAAPRGGHALMVQTSGNASPQRAAWAIATRAVSSSGWLRMQGTIGEISPVR